MPTRNINLTQQMDRFVDAKIKSGKYANASEVIRAAVLEGEESGVAGGDVMGEVRERMRRRAMATGRA